MVTKVQLESTKIRRTAAEIAANVTPTNYYYEPGDVRRYVTNTTPGTTDCTAGIQAAINTGYRVFISGEPGETFLSGPLTQTTAGQVIDFSGFTIKLKAGSSAYQLRLDGVGARVVGGTFDGNKAAGHTTTDAYYDHAAVLAYADDQVVENITTTNSIGLAIKSADASRVKIRNNKISGYNVQGIFFDGPSAAHEYDNEISGNHVTVTANTGVGIYLSSSATYRNLRGKVHDNTVVGPATAGGTEDVCISVNGEDCIIANNVTSGGDMGISCANLNQSIITGNRISDPDVALTGYGLEVAGSYNTISGNYIKGGVYGIQINGTPNAYVMNGNTITGNVIEDSSEFGIFVLATLASANYLNITGNTIKPLTGAPSAGIYLSGDCKYSLVAHNQLIGPGSAETGSAAVALISGTGHLRVLGNVMSGWEKGLVIYTGGAVAHTDITFSNNDCSLDMGAESTFVMVEGGATLGADIVQMFNTTSNGLGTNYLDRTNAVLFKHGSGSPESVVSAGIGSYYLRTNGGAGTTLYVKESGTGNTGWVGK